MLYSKTQITRVYEELNNLCDEVYSALKDDQWTCKIHNHDVFEQIVSKLLEKGTYPMTDERYAALKEDRVLVSYTEIT